MEARANPYEAYDEKIAASDLRKYRENGPRPWTQALLDALKAEGVEGATVLNIGGGIGVIQDELLAAGASHATMIEASAAYLEAAREEGERRGVNERVTYMQGDFLDLEQSVPAADIVTLERVLNVYPDWERLARDSARHAQRLYGVVVPREGLFVRGVISLINLRLRLQGKRLRAHAVPADVLRQISRGKVSARYSRRQSGLPGSWRSSAGRLRPRRPSRKGASFDRRSHLRAQAHPPDSRTSCRPA